MSHDRCICLRKIDYSETSQILQLFSREHGLLRVIAKGAHRRTKAGASKFDGGIDLLDLGEAIFIHSPERELSTLTEWHLLDGHLAIRRALRPMNLGLYAAELVSLLFEEHDAHPDLFDRLERTLRELETDRLEEAFLSFQLDMLRESGYLPEMGKCVLCTQNLTDRAYFSPARGGLVCRNCESTMPDRLEIDLRLIRLVQGMLSLPRANGTPQRLPKLTRHQTDPLNALLVHHIEHTLSKRLRLTAHVLP
jgi:DNA repair protein RecO (recombination protein O)